jgi:hypothetical protein
MTRAHEMEKAAERSSHEQVSEGAAKTPVGGALAEAARLAPANAAPARTLLSLIGPRARSSEPAALPEAEALPEATAAVGKVRVRRGRRVLDGAAARRAGRRRGGRAPRLCLVGLVWAAVSLATLGGGCARSGGAAAPPSQWRAAPALQAAAGGAALWADNCARCHNMRPSDQYSAKEWGIVMLHMRVRSGLTGEEGRAIRAFLEGGQ